MKKIFLTGASSGIGLATAKALVQRGHGVWGTSREVSRLANSSGLHPIRLDLTDRASVEEAWETALKQAGSFDVVINNAGSGHFGPAEFLSGDLLAHQFQILALSHMEICRLALQAMQKQERGLIVNITSLAARLPLPFMAGYNSAKAAMACFTMTMQLELGASPIRLVELQPGDIATDFNAAISRDGNADPRYAARLAQAWMVIERNMKKAPKPELVARRIVRLIEETNPAPRVVVGDFFEGTLAPLLTHWLPQRVRLWGLKKYYGI